MHVIVVTGKVTLLDENGYVVTLLFGGRFVHERMGYFESWNFRFLTYSKDVSRLDLDLSGHLILNRDENTF